MKTISVSGTTKRAVVDDGDFEKVKDYRWGWRTTAPGRKYIGARIDGKIVLLHRLILDPPPDKVVDHKDHDVFNNRRENIRVCQHKENMRNRKTHKNNKSGYKGVLREEGRWVARIGCDGKRYRLGAFTDKKDAAKAYNVAAMKYHGDYACLNQIE